MPSRVISECLACGSRRQREWLQANCSGSLEELAQYFLAHRKGVVHGRIVRCEECGFAFTTPQFHPSEYDELYRLAPRPRSGDEMDQANRVRTRRLAGIVRRFVPAGRPVLDFGAGEGSFLRALDDEAAIGFEVGAPGEKTLGKSRYLTGRFLDMAGASPFEAGSFEGIVALDVFEHLPDLDRYVAAIRTCLKPGGYCFATVPNIDSLLAKAMGARWNMILLEHLWYFSPKTLRMIMEKHGFDEVETRALPYDAPIGHIVRRLAQTFGISRSLGSGPLSRIVLPAPAGLMLGIYRAR